MPPTHPIPETTTTSGPRTYISGFFLEIDGWEKHGLNWYKGENEMTYDGCNWMLNGNKVQYVDEIKTT